MQELVRESERSTEAPLVPGLISGKRHDSCGNQSETAILAFCAHFLAFRYTLHCNPVLHYVVNIVLHDIVTLPYLLTE